MTTTLRRCLIPLTLVLAGACSAGQPTAPSPNRDLDIRELNATPDAGEIHTAPNAGEIHATPDGWEIGCTTPDGWEIGCTKGDGYTW